MGLRYSEEVVAAVSEEHNPRFARNLDWNLLKTYGEIVRAAGISRAARVLSRQQPSISSALKRLEDYLGAVLCQRGPSGFDLTEHGKAVAELASQLETLISSLPATLDAISDEPMFQVRLLVVGNLVSPRLDAAISRFSRKYPKAAIFINVAPCPEIEERLLQHGAEIGVSPSRRVDDRLRFHRLYREQHLPVCGRNHRLYGRTFTDPRALTDEPFVLPGADEAEEVRSYRKRFDWGTRVAGESLDLNEVKRMIAAGLGIAFLPQDFMQHDIDAGHIWPLMEPQVQNDIYVITNPANPRYLAVRRFLELLPPP